MSLPRRRKLGLPRRRRRASVRDILWWMLRLLNLSLLFFIASTTGVVLGTYSGIAELIPRARDLGDIRPGLGSRVLSAEGELLATVATENRQFVQLEEIPEALQDAIIAVEDREFHEHIGINPRAIVRAAVADIIARAPKQGASTITQQLARNLYLSQRRTMSRKLAEAVLALQLERAYTKPEIMELYLNQIYFGEGAYGVQVAAKTYFGKEVSELDLSECALLAGLPKAPERYSPFKDEQRATDRRNLVLAMMAEEGYIRPLEAAEAREAPLELVADRKPLGLSNFRAPYFTNYVLREVAARYGPDALYKGGLTIHTTLNLEMQETAEEAVAWGRQQSERYRYDVDQMALVAVDVHTGAIKAMVGGVDYSESQYNRTVQGGRQAGSAFKPFVYTAAFEQGYTPDSIVDDSPVSYPGAGGRPWTPRNYDRTYHGPVTFRKALAQSYNVSAVKVADAVGIGAVIATAERMGIYRPMDPYLPTAIGAGDVTPLEMASAFAVFGSGGMRTEPFGIRQIDDAQGRLLETHKIVKWRALDERVAGQMVEMLTEVIRSGTGARQAHLLGKFPVAGKTGTSSDYRDAWFVGFSDDLSCAVWAGKEEEAGERTPGGRYVTGATLPAPVWARFIAKSQPIMSAARASAAPERVVEIDPSQQGSPEPPTPPDSVPSVEDVQAEPGGPEGRSTPRTVTLRICPASGLVAGPSCPNPVVVRYSLAAGENPPRETCGIHGAAGEGEPSAGQPEPIPAEQPPRPRRVTLPICAITGQIASPRCPVVVNRTFEAEEAPTETCARHARPTLGP